MLEGLVSPAPTLEHLSLTSHGGYWNGVNLLIPDTLFDGSAPRLYHLQPCDCNISWKSPLLKGLEKLDILTPTANARPNLVVWLEALNEMPQLKKLTLRSASPIAPPFPLDVELIVTLLPLHTWISWPLRRIVRYHLHI
jgi:hypothetical protein